MPGPSLLIVCAVAGLSVFTVLTFLAGVIHLLNLSFPPAARPADAPDPAIVAAVAQAVHAAHPGTRITKIEELK